MEEVRKRRQLKREEKLQVYKEATVARAQGNGSVEEGGLGLGRHRMGFC